jgi:small subunit ribosomal protein S6
MFLLDSNRYARDPGGVSGKIGEMIEKCGGKIEVSRMWAEQKLAYQMGRSRKGVYWITYFRMEGSKLKELNRAAQLNNDVIRNLVLAVEPRLIDAMISHAKGTAKTEAPKAEEKKADGDAAPAEAKEEAAAAATK